jgi:hypothetical protein
MHRRTLGAVLIVCSLMVVLLVPAHAKGPTRAVIEGPGLTAPVVIRGSDVGILFFQSGFGFALSLCRPQDHCRSHRPHGDLGPRFVATYALAFPNAQGHIVRNHVVQYLYPQAQPKPLAYIPPGQPYAGRRTAGGTFTLGSTLLKNVTGLDLGATQPSAAPAVAPPPAPGPSADPMLLAGVAAVAVALIGVGAVSWRRRHEAAASHVPG